jgi:hypothetical protein
VLDMNPALDQRCGSFGAFGRATGVPRSSGVCGQGGDDGIEGVVARQARFLNFIQIDPSCQAREDDSSSIGPVRALVGLVRQPEHLERGSWVHLDELAGTISWCGSAAPHFVCPPGLKVGTSHGGGSQLVGTHRQRPDAGRCTHRPVGFSMAQPRPVCARRPWLTDAVGAQRGNEVQRPTKRGVDTDHIDFSRESDEKIVVRRLIDAVSHGMPSGVDLQNDYSGLLRFGGEVDSESSHLLKLNRFRRWVRHSGCHFVGRSRQCHQ